MPSKIAVKKILTNENEFKKIRNMNLPKMVSLLSKTMQY